MEEAARGPASDARTAPSAAGWPAAQGLKRPWWAALAALGLVVVLLHGLLVWWVQAQLPTLLPQAQMPARFTMARLGELQARKPPTAAPRPTPPPHPAAAPQPPARAASAPQPQAQVEGATPNDQLAAAKPPLPEAHAASAAAAAASAGADHPGAAPASPNPMLAAASAPAGGPLDGAPAADAGAENGFRWPAGTRIQYDLTGYYNGEVYGRAQVEWAKQGPRYQINLDVGVHLAMLELFARRMSSEGRITAQGLVPERYDEETRMALRAPLRSHLRFEPGVVTLANGRRELAPVGIQDTVSQFVQLTWLFASQGQPPQAGRTIEMPLALPHHASIWVFDVMEPETLSTPFGDIETWRVVPRRKDHLGRSVLLAQTWLAPAYRYLPVRIRITQGGQSPQGSSSYLDLTIKHPPQWADEALGPP